MGAWVAGAGAAVAILTAIVLRPRISAAVSIPLMALASAAVGWGAVLLLDDAPSAVEVMLIVGGLAVLGPLHARIVLGPYGRAP